MAAPTPGPDTGRDCRNNLDAGDAEVAETGQTFSPFLAAYLNPRDPAHQTSLHQLMVT